MATMIITHVDPKLLQEQVETIEELTSILAESGGATDEELEALDAVMGAIATALFHYNHNK